MLRIETGLVLLSLLIAWLRPTLGSPWFERAEAAFSRLAQRRALSVLLVGLTALGLRVAVLPVEPIPEPIVHDEFGYLLAADTFAHGRLTNPTHPMWVHFETFHVIHQPTYCTKYFPAQGLFLAFGQVFFGHPFWGVWLSTGLMCAAITWMLQGWMAPPWALLGGFIAIVRYGVFGYWADSYWGGSVAAIGGALALGALPRIKTNLKTRDAVIMGVGLAILATSRPWEGLVFALPVAALLFAWVFGKSMPSIRVFAGRVILPLAVVLTMTAAGLGYYFWRTTGSPVRTPYQVEHETYGVAPYMLWQDVRSEPPYRYEVMKRMYVGEELVGYYVLRSPIGYLLRGYMGWTFFLGPVLCLPFLMLAVSLPRSFSARNVDRSTLSLIFVLAVFAAGSAFAAFYGPHYSAPATGLIVALVLLATRQLRAWSQAGIILSRAICVICVLSLALRAAAGPLHLSIGRSVPFSWHDQPPASFGKRTVEQHLLHVPGKHLVIVHYAPDHEPFAEWVYNTADIDNAQIVWAREMPPLENQQLFDYFKDRQVWLLNADENPPGLLPYPPQTDTASYSRKSP